MESRNSIGRISFELDKEELQRIADAGQLGDFVDKATELFRRNLKAELINSVAAGSTTLVRLDGDDYGTGPIGPFPHVFAELDRISTRLAEIELLVRPNT